MSLIFWRFAKILLVLGVLSASAYYSLRDRVEREIGPWEQWVGADPTDKEVSPLKPRNLKGRFWTGVPRGGGADVTRIDRHGYSLGYSLGEGRTVWAAYLLPGNKPVGVAEVSRGIWKDDAEIDFTQKSGRRELSKAGQLVPYWLMQNFYEHAEDTWYHTNRVEGGYKTFVAWNQHLKEISEYAAVYGGVVCYSGPFANHETGEQGFFTVLLRKGERGPEALGFLLRQANDGGLKAQTVQIATIEELTGLRFFGDMPTEWRSYLRKKVPTGPWAR